MHFDFGFPEQILGTGSLWIMDKRIYSFGFGAHSVLNRVEILVGIQNEPCSPQRFGVGIQQNKLREESLPLKSIFLGALANCPSRETNSIVYQPMNGTFPDYERNKTMKPVEKAQQDSQVMKWNILVFIGYESNIGSDLRISEQPGNRV